MPAIVTEITGLARLEFKGQTLPSVAGEMPVHHILQTNQTISL